MNHPTIIQGGMGIGLSGWRLARAVSTAGQLGVVSGAAIEVVFARRLQDGDPGGHLRRALAAFPLPEIATAVLDKYLIAGGKAPTDPYRSTPPFTANPGIGLLGLTVVANFAEVWLAKEGHNGVVGINYLHKSQMSLLPSMYGAMLAGVDYVCMGAGIPREIPGALDKLARQEEAVLGLAVQGASSDDDFELRFDPVEFMGTEPAPLKRPNFLAIVSSSTLAVSLARKATGKVDGFVIEGPSAGGHNAPPRGGSLCAASGEPVYGARDEVDLDKVRALDLPFWLAGSYADPRKLEGAVALGARGIQVGTALAFCDESSLSEDLKRAVLDKVLADDTTVFTDPIASPTGFPFKVLALDGSLSEKDVYEARPRFCDISYLTVPYKKADGSLGYRCPAEPVEAYLRKGGATEDTVGRKCICTALVANIGLPQRQRGGYVERPILTAGNDIGVVRKFVKPGALSYAATDVIDYLLDRAAADVQTRVGS